MEGSVPGFWRRMLALAYESLLLLGVWFIAAFLFHLLFEIPQPNTSGRCSSFTC